MKSNPEFDSARKRHADEDNRQLAHDVKEVLNTAAGRRIFMAAVFQGGVYTHTHRGDDHVYLAGKRDAALELMTVANIHAPGHVLLARKERHDLISARNAELRSIETKGNDQ